MKQLIVKSSVDNLSNVLSKVDNSLEDYSIDMKSKLQLELVIEEIFINICNYAYETEGDIILQYNIKDDPLKISINFIDTGTPFNPLKEEAPDLSLSVDERKIGGLGLTIIKKNVDEIKYKYAHNQNILTIEKYLR